MKHYLIILLFMMCINNVYAQKLNVESFVVKTNDITARTQPRKDINKNDCALIKVQLAASGAVFSGNVVGDVSYNTSEYLVYMSQGSKKLTVKLEGYLPLEVDFQDYDIKSLEPKAVYLLKISGVLYVIQRGKAIENSILFDGLTSQDIYRMLVEYKQANKDVSDLVEKCNTAANQGDLKAQNLVGLIYDEGLGVPVDHLEAMKWFRKSANQGYDKAQCNLGRMYFNGRGVSRDYNEAAKWYNKAAEQGFAYAQNNLGSMYYDGRGVSRDYDEAAKWFIKAAEQGDANAQCNLGRMYFNGRGVSRDYDEAAKWYTKAAEQCHAIAQGNLGSMYYYGRGVSQDYDEAAKWFIKAAEQGVANAQYNIGVMYYNGRGVSRDYDEAAKWYTKAAEQGDADAKKALKSLR